MIQIQFCEDKSKLDLEKIFQLLSNSYWAQGRSRDVIKKSIEKSFCVGIYFSELPNNSGWMFRANDPT